MDLDSVVDFVDQAHEEIGKFNVEITLSPDKLMAEDYCVDELSWDFVSYGEDDVDDVPDDRRGIYAFGVCHENDVLPPNGCVFYIGIIATLTRHMSLQQAIKQAALLPRELTEEPFAELMWNASTSTIVNSHKVTLRETLLFMLGQSKYSEKTLLERYRQETGNETAALPEQVA